MCKWGRGVVAHEEGHNQSHDCGRKFSASPGIAEVLKGTGDALIGEARLYDAVCEIGLSESPAGD